MKLLDSLRTNLVIVLGVIFLTFKSSIAIKGYELTWDDSDYLKSVGCFSNAINEISLTRFAQCETTMWKAPVFQHIGVLSGLIILMGRYLGFLNFESLIPVSLSVLMFIQLTLLTLILHRFKRQYLQVFVLLIFYLVFGRTFFAFMTDTVAALAIALFLLYFIKYTYDGHVGNRRGLTILLCASFLVIGIRTTLLPVIFLPLMFLFLRRHYISRKEMRSLLKILVFFFTITAITYIFVWSWVINGALQAFVGNQSRYFALWSAKYGLDLVSLTFAKYQVLFIPFGATLCFVLFVFYQTTRASKVDRYLVMIHFVALIPGALVFFLFVLSDSKDPRFLEWPIFTFFVVLFELADNQMQKIRMKSVLQLPKILVLLPIASSFFIYGESHKSSFDMNGVIRIVNSLKSTQGVICPISDSKELNYPKLLLGFERIGIPGLQSGRVLNLADNALNGKSLKVSKEEFENCSFVAYDNTVEAGQQKSEYLGSYLSIMEEEKYELISKYESIRLLMKLKT